MENGSSMIEALIAGGVANKTIDAICAKLASYGAKKYRQYQAAKVVPDLFERIQQLDTVQTLFHDTPVSLSSFYYPSSILHSATTEVNRLRTAADVASLKNAVITGTMGQGKSMLMRWICLLEAKEGKKIPVFIELRKIDESTTILDLLVQALCLLGFRDIDLPTVRYMLEEGFLSIYADGFDEVRREFALRTQGELHSLTVEYRATRWVISTRRGSLSNHLHAIPRFSIYELMPLGEADLKPFLERVLGDAEQRESLLSQLAHTTTSIKGLLTTPLMVTLLAVLFKRSNGIPASIHDFYLQLFQVAAWHHDALKPSYVRERATSLSTSELQDVFETFTFLSKDHGVSLSDTQFNSCARKSATLTKKEFGPDGLRTELTEGVCLMSRDGLKTAFVHRGIQEFFAASFIRSQTDGEVVAKIYAQMRGNKLSQWIQELSFLQHIDQIRYLKYLFLPGADESLMFIDYAQESRTKVSKANVVRALKDIFHGVYIADSRNAEKFRWIFVLNSDCPYYNLTSDHLFASPDDPMIALSQDARERVFVDGDGGRLMSITSFIRAQPSFFSDYLRRFRQRANSLYKARAESTREIEARKNDLSSILFGN